MDREHKISVNDENPQTEIDVLQTSNHWKIRRPTSSYFQTFYNLRRETLIIDANTMMLVWVQLIREDV